MYTRKTTAIFLRDKNGRVLLQHRDKYAQRSPNCWGFFGGAIENGETPEQAIRREVKEELGIELNDLSFFKKFEYKRKIELCEVFVFIAPLTYPLKQLKKQQNEGDGLGLFSFEEIKKLNLKEAKINTLKELFKQ